MDKEYLRKLCTPAKIYLAIAVIASICMLFNGYSIMVVIMKLFFASIWTFVLGWLCKKGYKALSWFLVLLPYIIMGLAAFEIYKLSSDQKQMLKNIKLQGAYGN